jgi:uncharacterized phage protein (TIGR02216 family)
VTWAFRDWLVWAEAMGLGELALLPDQFWRLTVREFRLLVAGFHRREARAWEKIATLGLWVLAPYTKKKLTPAQLLGRSRLETAPPGAPAADDAATMELERARALAQALAWAQPD